MNKWGYSYQHAYEMLVFKFHVFSQGADTVIYERLANRDNDLKKTTREHLEQFGAAGLRTLCLAYRDLSSDIYENWNEKFIQAKSSLRDREKKLDEVSWSELHLWFNRLICLLYLVSTSRLSLIGWRSPVKTLKTYLWEECWMKLVAASTSIQAQET